MKNVAILLFLVYCTNPAFCRFPKRDFGPALEAVIPEMHEKCKRYTGMTEDLIDEMKMGKFPEDDRAKRYNLCLWTVNNIVMDNELKLDKNKLWAFLPTMHKQDAVIYVDCNQMARNSGEKDPAEIIWKMQKCAQSKVDEPHYIYF